MAMRCSGCFFSMLDSFFCDFIYFRGNNINEARDLKKIRGIVTITEIVVEGK